jgi:biopolymer transport protein ExbB
MDKIFDLLIKGGPVMWPLFALSIATVACAFERAWFWFQLLSQEDRIVHDVLAMAPVDLKKAAAIASRARTQPIGRFLFAALKLKNPTPETFRLALEASGDKEFAIMRKGDKLLETIIAVAPLLGLLGTVTGLIVTFDNLKIGSSSQTDATAAAAGIGEALITTASGMVVAIVALLFYRAFLSLQAQQIDYFSEVGSELELIYRQVWYEPGLYEKLPHPHVEQNQSKQSPGETPFKKDDSRRLRP